MDDVIEEELTIVAEREPRRRPALELEALRQPVRRLTHRGPLTLPLHATLDEAVRFMRDRHVGCVLLVDGERLAGIFTERDLLLKVESADRLRPVSEFMTADPDVLKPEAPIVYALNLMSVGGHRHVPLVDDAHRPVGVVSMRDVVHYLVAFFLKEVLTLPPDPMRAEEWRERDGA